MCACGNGHETVVRVLLESEKVTQDHIEATSNVRKRIDGLERVVLFALKHSSFYWL
jgi:hypothetical protein